MTEQTTFIAVFNLVTEWIGDAERFVKDHPDSYLNSIYESLIEAAQESKASERANDGDRAESVQIICESLKQLLVAGRDESIDYDDQEYILIEVPNQLLERLTRLRRDGITT